MRGIIQKSDPWRCQNYLDWVKSQPSCLTGKPAHDPHHIIGIGQDIGRNCKPSDLWTMALTRTEHDAFHDHGPKGWEMPYISVENLWQLWYAKQTIDRAFELGVLKLCPVDKQ